MPAGRTRSGASPEFYRALVESMLDPIVVVGADGAVRWASPSVEQAAGYAPGELANASSDGRVHPEDLEAARSAPAEEGGAVRVRHKDGSWRLVEGTVVDLLGDPRVCGIAVSGRVSTRTGGAGQTRQPSGQDTWHGEERYRAVVEQTAEGIYLVDAKTGRIIETNPALREMLGYEAGEDGLRGAHLHDIVAHPPEDIARNVRRTLKEGRRFIGERRYRRKDGSELDVEVGASTIRYGEEEVVCAVVRDVTWRKEAERRLREAEARYRALVEQIPVAAYTQDIENNTLDYLSPRFEEITGYPVEEYLADPNLRQGATIHPEDYERVIAEDERTDRTGEPYSVEYRKIRKDGTVIWVHDEAVLVRDEKGRPLYWQGILEDVTERKEAEARLRESEERFRLTFELAAVGMAQVGLDGRWLRVNGKLLEIVGYDREELLSKTFGDITHPDDLDADLDNARRLLAGRMQTYSVEKRYVRKDGSRVWVNLTVSLARKPSGEPAYFISIIEDITERKLKELVPDPLTLREIETLRLMARGKTNRQIGAALRHSLATAKLDARRVLEKLGVSDRAEAVKKAVEIGLLPPAPPERKRPPGQRLYPAKKV